LSSLVAFKGLLELEESNGRGEADSLTGLIGLVRKVPNVDTVLLGNEDHSRSGGRERSAGVVGGLSVFRAEDRLFLIFKRCLPQAEVEVVDGEEHVIVEGGAFESQAGSVIALSIKVSTDELVFSLVFVSCLSGSRGLGLSPVDPDEVSLIRASIESGGGLLGVEQNSAQAEVAGTIRSSQL